MGDNEDDLINLYNFDIQKIKLGSVVPWGL